MHFKFWPHIAVCLLSVLTWYSGDVNFRIDQETPPVPVLKLHDVADQWQIAQQRGTQAKNALLVTNDGIRLELNSPVADEPISVNRSEDVSTVDLQQLLAQASYATHLVPPFKNAALLTEAHTTRLSKPQLHIRQNAKPLLYITAHDEGAVVNELLIHRSSGLTATQTARALNVDVHPSTKLDLTWRITSPGIWRLDSVSLSWVALNHTYPQVVKALLSAWAFVALALVIFLAKRIGWKARLALTVLIALLLTGILVQQSLLGDIILTMNQSLTFWLPDNVMSDAFFIQKAGHFIAFAALGLLVLTQQKRLRLSAFDLVFFFLILAFATEAMQRHIPKRSSSIEDMLIDISGVLAGCLIFWASKAPLYLRRLVK